MTDDTEVTWVVRPCDHCKEMLEGDDHPGPWLCTRCHHAHERAIMLAQLEAAIQLAGAVRASLPSASPEVAAALRGWDVAVEAAETHRRDDL